MGVEVGDEVGVVMGVEVGDEVGVVMRVGVIVGVVTGGGDDDVDNK